MVKVLSALSLFAFATVAIGAPNVDIVKAREEDATPILELCNFIQCAAFPLGALGTCNNLVGAFAGFAGELTSATVPSGLVCTFFEKASCITVALADSEILDAAFGAETFNIRGTIAGAASSFQCSAF